MTYRIVPPWRHPYLAVLLVLHGVPPAAGRTFTDLGHFTSALIGLGCRPPAGGRGTMESEGDTDRPQTL
ncbi:rhomboid-like protein [Streptomyces triticisoli]|uniref:rhomboid-like protein n=1 Tax=Streptomyces triticisoli TaxID=2182797 RepID=UPI0018E587A9